MAEGKTIQEALRITPQDIPERKMVSNLGPDALRTAIQNYFENVGRADGAKWTTA